MDTRNKIILVTGATGKQGGAVARHLLNDGWSVRALTRDTNKPASRELMKRGAHVISGNLDDSHAVEKAIDGAYGVFSVQNFMEHGLAGEIRQGRLLADIAKLSGVRHFVYSSVASADHHTGIPHFESKWTIEEHIRDIRLPATVIRPAFFMDNFIVSPEWLNGIFQGRLTMALKPETRLQMVAVDDIGAMVAHVFANPDELLGCAIDLAGDELTGPEMARVFSSSLGKTVTFRELPIGEIRKTSEDLAVMYSWFNTKGLHVDIHAVRMLLPDLRTFEAWVSEKTWNKVSV